MTICTRCMELESKRQQLDQALAAAESCHHIGEDSACLECQACERYMSGVLERRLREVEKERDQALACEGGGLDDVWAMSYNQAAARGLLGEWREAVVKANAISQRFQNAESEVSYLKSVREVTYSEGYAAGVEAAAKALETHGRNDAGTKITLACIRALSSPPSPTSVPAGCPGCSDCDPSRYSRVP